MANRFFESNNGKILVVGDVMLDEYWYGQTSRISPEAPVPVVRVEQSDFRPGGAGNVAVNIASLGFSAELIGFVGVDDAGKTLLDKISGYGIQHKLVALKGFSTIAKLRVLSRNQQLLRCDREQIPKPETPCPLQSAFEQSIKQCDVAILSDYAKGALHDPQYYIQHANNLGLPVVVDPKRHDFSVYRGATVITPNYREFEAVVGHCSDEEEIIKKGQELLSHYQIQALFITRGSEGITVIEADKAKHFPACSGEVYDVTGAGDTVVAVVATCISLGISLREAAKLAIVAGGIVVGKVGTSVVTKAEITTAMAHQNEPAVKEGVLSENELRSMIQCCQSRKEKIVFANGCFDVLHYGHIRFLERAKAQGDRLIVGVNDDASVKRLKGADRPAHPLKARMEVLGGLKAVDWVVPFSEDTPGRLVESLGPDVLVKGDEHFKSIEDIPDSEGAQYVLSRGGKVVLITRTPGYASTDCLEYTAIDL